jgi:short subunit dehydrogenase-like uncharacterized protein
MNKKWMLYGASGYTGKLIASMCKDLPNKPVIAGRNLAKISAIAEKYELEYEIFELTSRNTTAKKLEDYELVLNCAGPFSQTAHIMVAACLNSNTHYLDITGEASVFKHCSLLDLPAKKAGIILCPGTGFDVVPTDCVAASLAEKLPNATHLNLGFDSRSPMSRGTMNTMIEGISKGGLIRKAGKMTSVALAFKSQSIDFGNGKKMATTIPWGDLETAYSSTGIPNIEVYIPMSPKKIKKMRRLNRFKNILAWKWVQNFMLSKVQKLPEGPSNQQLEEGITYVWGEVFNDQGEMYEARLQTKNGYQFTALASLEAVNRLLNNQFNPGYFTPSQLFGCDFVSTILGSSEICIEKISD